MYIQILYKCYIHIHIHNMCIYIYVISIMNYAWSPELGLTSGSHPEYLDLQSVRLNSRSVSIPEARWYSTVPKAMIAIVLGVLVLHIWVMKPYVRKNIVRHGI